MREDGAVVEGLDVSGQVTVFGDNVTIRNTRIRTSGGLYGIRQVEEAGGMVVEDVDIIGTDARCSVGIVTNRYTARRIDVSGCEDGLRVGSQTVVEDSYIHDQRYTAGAHNDGAQSIGGTGIRMTGNRIEGPYQEQTSALLLHANFVPLRDVHLEGNLLSGGTYTLNIKQRGDNPVPDNVAIIDNVWIRDSYKFGTHQIEAEGLVMSGNLFDDGTAYAYTTR